MASSRRRPGKIRVKIDEDALRAAIDPESVQAAVVPGSGRSR